MSKRYGTRNPSRRLYAYMYQYNPPAYCMWYVACASCTQFWTLYSEGNLIAHAAAGDLLSLSTSTYVVHQIAPFGETLHVSVKDEDMANLTAYARSSSAS